MSIAATLRVLVDASTDMPMAHIESESVLQGIQFDLAQALAKETKRNADIIFMPRNRIVLELEKGHADISCHYRPSWLPGKVDWTIPFMPNGVLLIAHRTVKSPVDIAKLKNVPIGTVLGYSYSKVQAQLGKNFVREEAPNATSNLRKLSAGRMNYALVSELFFEYQKRAGLFNTPIHPPVLMERYLSQCAVSKQSSLKVSQIDAAIESLRRSKKLSQIYSRYGIDYSAQFP